MPAFTCPPRNPLRCAMHTRTWARPGDGEDSARRWLPGEILIIDAGQHEASHARATRDRIVSIGQPADRGGIVAPTRAPTPLNANRSRRRTSPSSTAATPPGFVREI